MAATGAEPESPCFNPALQAAAPARLVLVAAVAEAPRTDARPPAAARVGGDDAAVRPMRRDEPKLGRNDPCPCGSGKKYKHCHGQLG